MRKRSKYRPKGVIQDTVGHVLGGFRLVQHTGKAVTLKIKNHQALASMVAGTGSREDIDILIAAMNVAEVGIDKKDDTRNVIWNYRAITGAPVSPAKLKSTPPPPAAAPAKSARPWG